MAGGVLAPNTPAIDYRTLVDPNRKWYNNRRLLALNGWMVLLLITSSTVGYDGSMLNGLQSIDNWHEYFNNPDDNMLGLLSAIQNIGSFCAFFFTPYVSDGLGRRSSIFFGSIIMVIATVIQTASQNVGMFLAARFVIGFGLAFAACSAPLLVSEVAYPTHRAPLTSAYNSLWYSGSIIAAWTTFGTEFMKDSTWAWRIPSALQALPSVIQIALIFFCPESPRWLISKGRNEQALKTLAYYHADGNEEDPLVKYEYEEIKAAIEFDRTVAAKVGWKTLFATAGNRRRMRIIIALAFFSQWSGNGLVSYYLNKVFDTVGITNSSTQLLLNGILQVWNLIWALAAALVVDKVGRRILFMTSIGGMTLFFTLMTITAAIYAKNGDDRAGHAFIGFIFLYYAAYDVALSPLIVSYTVEILPYAIRAKGLAVFNIAISLSLVFNQYVNPVALGKLEWRYYIVYVVWLAVEFVFVYFFVIETKNRTLEETAALFDTKEETAALAIAHAAHDATLSADEKVSPSASVDGTKA
ncbi:hexose transporter [Coprinopsis marcescibilis]|uniref:Hexose transporter n=1 Tax=Coprinopsis marcescibilis TaxID=230819 RepID=A0A5C3KRV5_COPMA|nr:hexose transporter [Coprinopsis marcescibilis]